MGCRLSKLIKERALHKGFIFCCNLLWSDSIDTVSIIANSDEKRSEEDGHIKTVSFLPFCYIGRTWYTLRELIWWIQFLILNEFADFLSTINIVMKLQETKLGGTDSGTYKLVDIALILRI